MPAHSILGWLRKRRALSAGTRRLADPFWGASAGEPAGFAPPRAAAPRPVLLAPRDWRERMLTGGAGISGASSVPPAPAAVAPFDDLTRFAERIAPRTIDEMGGASSIAPTRRDDADATPARATSTERAAQLAASKPPLSDARATETAREEAPVRSIVETRRPEIDTPSARARLSEVPPVAPPPHDAATMGKGASVETPTTAALVSPVAPVEPPHASLRVVAPLADAAPSVQVPLALPVPVVPPDAMPPAPRVSVNPPPVELSAEQQDASAIAARSTSTGGAHVVKSFGERVAKLVPAAPPVNPREAEGMQASPRVREPDAAADLADAVARALPANGELPTKVPDLPLAPRADPAPERAPQEATRPARRDVTEQTPPLSGVALHADSQKSSRVEPGPRLDHVAEEAEQSPPAPPPVPRAVRLDAAAVPTPILAAEPPPSPQAVPHAPMPDVVASEPVRTLVAPDEHLTSTAAPERPATDGIAAVTAAAALRDAATDAVRMAAKVDEAPSAPPADAPLRAATVPSTPDASAPSDSTADVSAPIADASTLRERPPTADIRAVEERRGRRSSTPVPRLTARKPVIGATREPPTPPPHDALPRSEPIAASATPEANRSMNDWRRLLFEATREPAPRDARAGAPIPAPAHAPIPQPTAPPPAMRTAQLADARAHATASASTVAPPVALPAAAPVASLAASPAAPRDTPIAARPAASADSAPLLESTRRFLRPRVGIDPSTVPIVRGPHADQFLANARADAAAIGETIALPSVHDERSPRALGLLAHELTHVAQRRAPRFVPPVVRTPRADAPPARPGQSRQMPSAEEGLARRVERAVRSDAERGADRSEDDDLTVSSDVGPVVSALADVDTMPERDAKLWGTLPAPWEPMTYAPATSSRATSTPAMASAPVDTAAAQFAEQGRALDEPASSVTTQSASASSASSASSSTPAPDLDALARRVYDVLKRRLAAERRREG
ncbi:MAG: DUF4157 domain-containing protein [Gemmatimonadaceae bacterium]